MVQPRSRLRFRETARRIGRRGRVRAHGNGAHVAPARASAGADARSADRTERKGADRGRAARLRRAGGVAGALIVLLACSPQAPAQNPPVEAADPRAQTGLREVPLTIRSKNGVHRFTVEVAATAAEQERGLMYRRSVAADRGMIFPYEPAQEVSFWMENTWVPLDIVFVGADRRIVRITKAEAMDLTPLPSGAPVIGVL